MNSRRVMESEEEKKIKEVILELDGPDMTILNSLGTVPQQLECLPKKQQAIALNELNKWVTLIRPLLSNDSFLRFQFNWPCWHEYRVENEKIIERYAERKREEANARHH